MSTLLKGPEKQYFVWKINNLKMTWFKLQWDKIVHGDLNAVLVSFLDLKNGSNDFLYFLHKVSLQYWLESD